MSKKSFIEIYEFSSLSQDQIHQFIQMYPQPTIGANQLSACGLSERGLIRGRTFSCVDLILFYRDAPPQLVKRLTDMEVYEKNQRGEEVTPTIRKQITERHQQELLYGSPPAVSFAKLIFVPCKRIAVLIANSRKDQKTFDKQTMLMFLAARLSASKYRLPLEPSLLGDLIHRSDDIKGLKIHSVEYPTDKNEDGVEHSGSLPISIKVSSEHEVLILNVLSAGAVDTVTIGEKFQRDWVGLYDANDDKQIDSSRLEVWISDLTNLLKLLDTELSVNDIKKYHIFN